MASRSTLLKPRRLQALPSVVSPASPFLKWAGGKSQLLNTFQTHLPETFKSYFEPFTGGAALFFYLHNNKRVVRSQLSDQNEELINCYTVVRDNVDELIDDLKKHINDEEYFYHLRAVDARSLSEIQRASRLIYLNKTCFNGLYRVNSKGHFNVPFGFYKNPNTCNETNLRACSKSLQEVKIKHQPFELVLDQAKKGDFVYFDPPYHPLNSTSNFTSYTKQSFTAEDQRRLADTFEQLHKRGCKVMLSNSDCELIRDLYASFRIETVYAMRAINCKAKGRGRITELLVLNY